MARQPRRPRLADDRGTRRGNLPLPVWPARTGYGLVLGKADLGERAMIQLYPDMKPVTACYFLRLSGYRLRWNIQKRALEIIEI